jgi:XRE family transcriptional regulator, regulator of sulfur utilization
VRAGSAKPRKEKRKAQQATNVRRLVGERVAQLRRANGLSQEALAELSGMHRNFLSEIERGVKGTTVVALARVAQGLGVDPSALIEVRAQATDDELRGQLDRKIKRLSREGLLTALRVLDAIQPDR